MELTAHHDMQRVHVSHRVAHHLWLEYHQRAACTVLCLLCPGIVSQRRNRLEQGTVRLQRLAARRVE